MQKLFELQNHKKWYMWDSFWSTVFLVINCYQIPTLQILLIGQLLMLELLDQILILDVDSVAGPLFANKVHLSHPMIDVHPE